MHIAILIDKTWGDALFRGGRTDIYRAEHGGRPVAVKSIRTYTTSNLEEVTGVNAPLFVFWGDFCS